MSIKGVGVGLGNPEETTRAMPISFVEQRDETILGAFDCIGGGLSN